MIKPGYKTSEFWFTLVSFIFSGLFLIGVIGDNGQKEELIRDVSHGVESMILIGGQVLILWNYISSRKVAKSVSPNTNLESETNESNQSNKRNRPNNTTNKSRSNKNRSRKTNTNNKTKSQRSKKNSGRWSLESFATIYSYYNSNYRSDW